MKVGLYSPYIPKHFGGGEKHLLTTAWYLSQNHQVEVLIPQKDSANITDFRAKYEKMFDLDLQKVKFVPSALATGKTNPLKTWQITHHYDVFFYLTDGSLFMSGAKKNILHIQMPFTSKAGKLFDWKLRCWDVKNANSQFTKDIVAQAWDTEVPYVHYPYAKIPDSRVVDGVRQPNILAVGRFINPFNNVAHSKHQEVLLEAFAAGRQQFGWKNWTLTLVGGIEPGDDHHDYVQTLKEKYADLPVTWLHDIADDELKKLYLESSLFWHAAGYGVDEQSNPKQVEHFGMSTIEAMSYGLIPFVVPKGGLKEIISNTENGFYFSTPQDLAKKSQATMELPAKEIIKLRQAAYDQSKNFSLERFCSTIDNMIGVK